MRRSHNSVRVGGVGWNDAPAPQRQACTKVTVSASSSSGKTSRKGCHHRPSNELPASAKMTKYHSGIIGSDSIRLGIGSYNDWKGAVPHIP